MIKFIATDMDGTLLNSKNEIHPSFYETFEKLKQRNIIFAAASGRQYFNLAKRFEAVADDMMFIAENGTFVVYKGEEVFVNALDRQIANELIAIGRQVKEAFVILCGKKAAYIEVNDKKFIAEVEKYYERYEIVENLEVVEDEVLKVTLCDFLGSESNSNHYFNDYKEDLQVTVSGQIWLDITAKGANKGVAINKVRDMFDIAHERAAAFGDYLNDLEMMESVYHSYAMENAHEDLKKVARFSAKSNDENGVVEAIEQLLELTMV
ncbi:MAG TPA: HAD family hydrolase [Firmicutes bacterium]|nr:HAD family hydrolase [Bacillota bacterium]